MATAKKDNLRNFIATKDDKTLIALSVPTPSKKEVEAADLEYSGTFNRMLMGGLPTQTKMLRELRENEVISPKDEESIGQLSQDLRALDEKIRSLSVEPEKHAVELASVRTEKTEKGAKLSALNREIEANLAHTADAKAFEAQRNFLIACVVEHSDGPKQGQRYYNSVEELTGETDNALLNRVVYEYMVCQQSLPSEWDTIMNAITPKTEEPEKAAQTTEAAAVKPAETEASVEPKIEL